MSDRPTAVDRIARLAVALLLSAPIIGACVEGTDPVPRAAHPALDCGPEGSGTGNYDVIGPGFDTTAAALDDRLSYYQGLYGGEVVDLPNDEAALQVDGSNVVAPPAPTTAEGGFLVQEDYFCNDFQPQQRGTPATEPPVTTVP